MAWKVKTTSAEVNGVPSDQVASRNVNVKVRLSAEAVQDSASPGSTSWVERLMRTSVLCIRCDMKTVGEVRSTHRLNERGSLRNDDVSTPPRVLTSEKTISVPWSA